MPGDLPDEGSPGPTHDQAAELASELRALVGKLKRRLRDEGHADDLTPSQVSALLHLERGGPSTVSALAAAEGVRPQSMGATIAALESQGLVAGAPDPEDGRRVILALTPACRTWLAQGRAARQDWLTRAFRRELTLPEQIQLTQALQLLRRVADS